MSFIPHTEADVREMLDAIGAERIEDLFDEIPTSLREQAGLEGLPPPRSEQEVLGLLSERAQHDEGVVCFAGAGAYDHYVPAAVWDLTARGEFMTAYTPYQAEASQGTLQLIYEYQTMICELTAMDVSNASVYDGGSGLAEAVLMAVRANRKVREPAVLLAGSLNPRYRRATETIVRNQGIELREAPLDPGTGLCPPAEVDGPVAAVVVQYPNFFGGLEDVDAWTDWAHERGALVIAVCNPMALALLRPPGEWGAQGADIAVGDGQPMGIPMSSGGPYFGYLCARQGLVRQLPGRIIGRTVDLEGRDGYTLTLQAREQHIRRAKATSNICTNQGLLVTAGTIYMALMGARGLRAIALRCHQNTAELARRLSGLQGVEPAFGGPFFHETAVRLPVPAGPVIDRLARQGVLAGVCPGEWYPGMDDVLLTCATEQRTEADITRLHDLLDAAVRDAAGRAA